ncbi:15713_t:CDS:2, partial [Dentiscutata heterogama]
EQTLLYLDNLKRHIRRGYEKELMVKADGHSEPTIPESAWTIPIDDKEDDVSMGQNQEDQSQNEPLVIISIPR